MKRGYRKPRKVRPIEKDIPKGYDSKWEYTLHQSSLKDWSHHSDKISYIVEHSYEPDFTKVIEGKEYLLRKYREFYYKPPEKDKFVDNRVKSGEDILSKNIKTLKEFLDD